MIHRAHAVALTVVVLGAAELSCSMFSRMVKQLDLLESNHGCGLNGLSRESVPKRK
jgi:hypothetical protein